MQYYRITPIGIIKVYDNEKYIEIYDQYINGLIHINNFSYIFVLWWLSQRDNSRDRATLIVSPPHLDTSIKTGVFSCRSPVRPNPIALTIVKVLSLKKNRLYIDSIDAYDNSPVIDIKPYLPSDSFELSEIRVPEWFEYLKLKEKK